MYKRLGYDRRKALELMYRFEDEVTVKPSFAFADTVDQVASKSFPDRFEEGLAKAMSTAK
ncbi:MAG: hypothetical protein HQL67_10930 [Magnetococcales bacterium]|nr:hypothetical protein [Magnetococcales bacterium]